LRVRSTRLIFPTSWKSSVSAFQQGRSNALSHAHRTACWRNRNPLEQPSTEVRFAAGPDEEIDVAGIPRQTMPGKGKCSYNQKLNFVRA
jgi:hypothetical protein